MFLVGPMPWNAKMLQCQECPAFDSISRRYSLGHRIEQVPGGLNASVPLFQQMAHVRQEELDLGTVKLIDNTNYVGG